MLKWWDVKWWVRRAVNFLWMCLTTVSLFVLGKRSNSSWKKWLMNHFLKKKTLIFLFLVYVSHWFCQWVRATVGNYVIITCCLVFEISYLAVAGPTQWTQPKWLPSFEKYIQDTPITISYPVLVGIKGAWRMDDCMYPCMIRVVITSVHRHNLRPHTGKSLRCLFASGIVPLWSCSGKFRWSYCFLTAQAVKQPVIMHHVLRCLWMP